MVAEMEEAVIVGKPGRQANSIQPGFPALSFLSH